MFNSSKIVYIEGTTYSRSSKAKQFFTTYYA